MTASLRRADLHAYDGQSLVLTPDLVDNFPSKVAASFTHTVTAVVARSGTSWVDRDEDDGERVDRLLASATGTKVFVDCGGQSDIIGGASAATILANAESYWNQRIAAGWDFIVACTVIDAKDSTYDASMDAVRATLNTSIRGSASADAVADLALIPEFIPFDVGTYSSDGLHVNDAATDLIAPVVLAAIQSL